MSERKSKFSGLAGSLRARKGAPSEASAPKKMGKSKDKDNYTSTTVYLLKPVHEDVQVALVKQKKELSQLVEDLLVEWLKRQ